MTKILIDTNIFLGLYESNNDPITIFDEDISKLRSDLIFTDQIYDEFLRNRDKELEKLIALCKNNKCIINSSSIIRSLRDFSKLKDIKNNFKETNDLLIKKLQDIMDDIAKDTVFQSFLKLYNHSDVIKYEKNEEIIKEAHKRKLLGNPPMGNKQNTIGDEVIWETILANLKDNFIIVTRDRTYINHISFLRKEYYSITNKDLNIFENISDALKHLGKEASNELNKFEEEQSKIMELPIDSSGNKYIPLSKYFKFRYDDASENIQPHLDLEFCPRCGNHDIESGRCSVCGFFIYSD